MMKLLMFTDTHGSRGHMKRLKQRAERADLIVCAGDFTVFGHDLHKILKEMDSWKKPLILIPGNHEEHIKLKEECGQYKNVMDIDRDFYEKENILFAGYGRGGFSYETPEFDMFGRKIKRKAAEHKGKWVFIIHQPPFGTATDLLDFGHTGNETFAAFIAQEQPDLVICGHLHENFRKEDTMGKSRIINPGPDGMMIDI